MTRYFLEVSYIGTEYAGFQIQRNANSIQAEVEKALQTLLKSGITLTGSSRTDAGVHALQNFFHFDTAMKVPLGIIYNLNALLPQDIAAKNLVEVAPAAHCRFDAIGRRYSYHIYGVKNPFLTDRAYYYPYPLALERLQEAAAVLGSYSNYASFSKRRTQVQTFDCAIIESNWRVEEERLVYHVRANRFLRGMVRGLVGTMLHVGKGKMQVEEFRKIIEQRNSSRVDFSVPARGLFLEQVFFPDRYFLKGNDSMDTSKTAESLLQNKNRMLE